jgi:flagellar basal-body rod protein FlgC
MNLFGVMDISGSALQAERVRAEVVASNMANAETTRTPDGGPYKRHHVVFAAVDSDSFGASLLGQVNGGGGGAAGTTSTQPAWSQMQFALAQMKVPDAAKSAAGGVEVAGVVEDQGGPQVRFDPQHPDADANGYVSYPDINPLTEMTDLMSATRSYGMNASAIQAEKGMLTNSLELLK